MKKRSRAIEIGTAVWYSLWTPLDGTGGRDGKWEPRGPVIVIGLKHEGNPPRISHVKLMDSPCWIAVDKIFRVQPKKQAAYQFARRERERKKPLRV